MKRQAPTVQLAVLAGRLARRASSVKCLTYLVEYVYQLRKGKSMPPQTPDQQPPTQTPPAAPAPEAPAPAPPTGQATPPSTPASPGGNNMKKWLMYGAIVVVVLVVLYILFM
jgi:hypothetical protein